MKSFNHIYEKIISEENRKTAVNNAIKGKTKKKKKKIQKYIDNKGQTIKDLEHWIEDYRNDNHKPIEIYDGISRKKRTIIVPTFKELAVQHAIVNAMCPIFLQGVYEHSYAAIPGRGTHLGKKTIEKWIRNDSKNCKYILKMDIRHFFNTIPHNILKNKLAKTIHDEKALKLLYEIIDVTDIGIPLGFYTSQWISNWYLTELDHFIKEELNAVHYIRYMDDMVIFGSNKKKLHKMREAIEKYLNEKLGLKLKGNYQIFRFVYNKNGKEIGRDLDFMGFRFFRNRTTLRKSIMIKASRIAKRLSRKIKITIYDIRRIMAYLGYIDATDTYNMYCKYILPYISFQKCKRRLSNFDKRINKMTKGENKNDLFASRRFTGEQAA